MRRSASIKSALAKLLAAEAARMPTHLRGGISAHVSMERDDTGLYDAKSGFTGAVRFLPHIIFKIPLTATQREIRRALKHLLQAFSKFRGEFNPDDLRVALSWFERERKSIEKIASPRKRKRKLGEILAKFVDLAYGQPGQTVGKIRSLGHAPYASQSGAADLREKRDHWIRRRYKELGRDGLSQWDRYVKIQQELLDMGEADKNHFGQWSWKKQDPYQLSEITLRKITTHKS